MKMINRKKRGIRGGIQVYSLIPLTILLFPTSRLNSVQLKKEIPAWFHADQSAAHSIKAENFKYLKLVWWTSSLISSRLNLAFKNRYFPLSLSLGATFGLLPKKRENVKRKKQNFTGKKAWETPPSSSDNGLHIPDVMQILCHVDTWIQCERHFISVVHEKKIRITQFEGTTEHSNSKNCQGKEGKTNKLSEEARED